MLVYSLGNRQPKTEHLHGATMGQAHLRPLIPEIGAGSGQIVVLDFDGMLTATSSYLKATVIRLLNAARLAAESGLPQDGALPPLNIFPMVMGLREEVREEFVDVLAVRKLVLLEAIGATNSTENVVRRALLHGSLDDALKETVQCLNEVRQPIGATELTSRYRKSIEISETGWNNRLSELHRLRILRRVKEGRQWVYEQIAKEVVLDG